MKKSEYTKVKLRCANNPYLVSKITCTMPISASLEKCVAARIGHTLYKTVKDTKIQSKLFGNHRKIIFYDNSHSIEGLSGVRDKEDFFEIMNLCKICKYFAKSR